MQRSYAIYNSSLNQLDVIRPGESITRRIPCVNLDPSQMRVHGVEISGDEIRVLVGPHNNPRPNRYYIYYFSRLSGGASRSI